MHVDITAMGLKQLLGSRHALRIDIINVKAVGIKVNAAAGRV